MNTEEQSSTALDQLAVGKQALISEIIADRQMAMRLLSLGIRVGSEVEVTQQRNKGVVIACAGSRVALGGAVARNLYTQPLNGTEILQ